MKYLADTNILAELGRQRPNQGVLAWADKVRLVGVSVISVEEMYFGLGWKPNVRIETWLERFLADHCELLPITPDVATLAGRTRGALQAAGATRSQADMLIAATAAHHGLTLVTRNERDFQGCGVTVLNPFTQ